MMIDVYWCPLMFIDVQVHCCRYHILWDIKLIDWLSDVGGDKHIRHPHLSKGWNRPPGQTPAPTPKLTLISHLQPADPKLWVHSSCKVAPNAQTGKLQPAHPSKSKEQNHWVTKACKCSNKPKIPETNRLEKGRSCASKGFRNWGASLELTNLSQEKLLTPQNATKVTRSKLSQTQSLVISCHGSQNLGVEAPLGRTEKSL